MTYKKYKPEYTQLPFGITSNYSALQKLIRTKGPTTLAIYTVIQDKSAGHSEDDFSLSREELIDDIRETLYLHTASNEELNEWIDDFINAGILEEITFVNKYTDIEETRLCIRSVLETLEETRESWVGKCINPLKIPKAEKDKLKDFQDRIRECRKQINARQEAKQRLRAQLSRELAKSNCDTQNAQTCNSAIEEYEKECAMLYRKLHNLTREMEKISKGGDGNED